MRYSLYDAAAAAATRRTVEMRLDEYEVHRGAMAGVARRLEGMRRNAKPGYGNSQKYDWQIDIEGALGEMVIAKHLNLYWDGKGKLCGTDVGGEVEVRTGSEHNFRLILYAADHDDKPYWLVTGRYGQYRIHGWVYGGEGKQAEYWDQPRADRPAAYYVPQERLRCPLTSHQVPDAHQAA